MIDSLKILDNDAWYKDGLHFKCTGCGKCCTGSPGYVWLTEEDIKRFCKHLHISREDFLTRYTMSVHNRISLKEVGKKYDCIFYKDKKCTVYDARPSQCRTFPWWLSNLKSKENWIDASNYCEGIHHEEAEKVPFEKIRHELKRYLENTEKIDR